uniref:Bicaudal C n=1 Tax=Hemicentrotus pulcherrimus TaxID=7650 RepID=A0A060Q2R0_HEMPU|nr:bicaudal C [Hemicentrotus pulcherrimus]
MNSFSYDPHIKVAGKLFHVAAAKEKIMSVLDTKSNRVTLKMDVSYTEHSHVIGKGGAIIKKVMDDTKCHIHFPDSNRGSQQEKSNQVSIAGQIAGVEQARAKIRELLPLVLIFELPITMGPVPSMNSPIVQEIVQTYKVAVNMKQRGRGYSTTVTVRGAANNARGMKEGTTRLMEHLTGAAGGALPVSTQIEISPRHHQFMMGRGGLNIKQITQCTGASIHFPDPNSSQKKSSVFVSGSIDSVIVARHLLMGCLPLVLMFDMREEVEVHTTKLAQLMEQLDIFISIKPKPKQPNKSVIVKSIERNTPNMYRARQILLGQECESCAVNANPSRGMNGTCLPVHGYNVGTVGLLGHHHHHHQGSMPGLTTTVLPTLNGLANLNNRNALHLTNTSTTPTQWTLQNIPTSLASGLTNATMTQVLVQQPVNPLLLTSPRGSISFTANAASNPVVTNPSMSPSNPTAATVPTAVHTIPSVTPMQATLPTNQVASSVQAAVPANPTMGMPTLQTALPTSPTGMQVPQDLGSANQTVLQPVLSQSVVGNPTAATSIQQTPLQISSAASMMQPSTTQTQVFPTPALLPQQTLQATMQQMQGALNQARVQQQLPQDFFNNLNMASTAASSTTQSPFSEASVYMTTPHKPPPPPGFAKQDPMTSQLAQLELNDITARNQFTSMCNNNNHMKDLMMQLKSMQMTQVPNTDTHYPSNHRSSQPLTPRDVNSIDLITTVTPPLGQLGQSSDQNLDHSGSSSGHSIPRSPTSFVDLVLAQNNNLSPSSSLKLQNTNFSPNNSSHDLSSMLGGGRRSLTPDESSVSLFSNSNGSVTLNGYGTRSSESGCDSDSSDKRAPGCERRERRRERKLEQEQQENQEGGDPKELQSAPYGEDYDQKKFLATKAMKKKPVVPEVRVPTDLWSGLGFSKSMPEPAIREARRTNGFSLFQMDSNPLPTTYETPNQEGSEHLEAPSSVTTTSTTSTWPPDRLNGDPPPTDAPNNGFDSTPGYAKKKKTTFSDISCSSYIESTTLPKPSKGLWTANDLNASLSSRPDLGDIFMNLGLGKYTDVFQQQEIDLSTFLTLTDRDLKELGITTFGARRKMLLAISDLNNTNKDSLTTQTSIANQGFHGNTPSNGLIAGQSSPHPTSCW